MFGFLSLPKLIFTVVIVLAVWYGFKWYNRRQQIERQRAQGQVPPGGAGPSNKRKEAAIEDMVQCPDCGAYVPADGRHKCG